MTSEASTWAVVGRRACLAGLLAVAGGLIVWPAATATLFWWGVLPLLPAVFLLHPGLWRNVCPLATVSMGPDRGPRHVGAAAAPSPWAGAAGVAPLLVLVALRGLGLDTDPLGTGALLAGIVGVAAVTGRRGERRSGFCNRLCPLLPVERLYGQRPWVEVGDSRCDSCTLCTSRGCVDLSPPAAVAQLLGPDRGGIGWLLTPFGAFAAAFPGFVAAWFKTVPAAPSGLHLAGALAVGLLGSWFVTAAVVRWTRLSWRQALPTLAALAAGAYYGYAAPRAVAAFGGTEAIARIAQGVALAGIVAWWVHAMGAATGSPRPRRV